ncbi:Si-specific NAD(P)(+) transhydrogenase [Cerasicoccus arenae]|uniref:Soluble pyridine nucleotide transhydrogenase n=1 Tax=Cerasicoccus arenae TaxID=424488 RepID=A0A8J3DF25_9BACT|nr:Si-specific NAD(P)(+) transhydrogenase [Cerasicoccus arenae]MBK1857128.1 Si-specific NAD(P)(+) transhydrogenase [Cerasicoccus arenae]GHB92527.1 NAD(P)(+) transhydrogenase [Cerasicoccus arenae]
MKHYDLIVIGSGPAGEKAAVKAAYHGKSVAVVEKESMLGGAGTNTGTLPSKTLKETALYYSGINESGLFGVDKELKRAADAEDFFFRKNEVQDWQELGIEKNFVLHNIDVYKGKGTVINPNRVQVVGVDDALLEADFILIATGSYPFQPEGIPFDGKFVHDSDTILSIKGIPKSMVIVGAGVIGCEYATIFAVMGTKVKLVNGHGDILTFLDPEIRDQLVDSMEHDNIEFVLNQRIEKVEILPEDHEFNVHAKLSDGDPIQADMFLYAAGRSGQSAGLGLAEVGVEIGSRGNIVVDKEYRSAVPSIFAVGDVIGFPALASTGMDQGRVAVSHMFGFGDQVQLTEHFPYGIYTIPEVSVYGLTEEEAKQQGYECVVGRARYVDMPRGKIMGVKRGMLKMVVDKKTERVLGVHIIGKIATELVHYGMALVDSKATIETVINRVYNMPTLHELYKYAAYNVLIEGHYLDAPTGH